MLKILCREHELILVHGREAYCSYSMQTEDVDRQGDHYGNIKLHNYCFFQNSYKCDLLYK